MESNEEIKLEAIEFYGPGGCPHCSATLYVADSELTLMEVNRDGIPISESTTITCKAVCPNCGEKFEMMRHNGGYIPYSRDSEIWNEIQHKERAQARLKELISETKNPLAYGVINK